MEISLTRPHITVILAISLDGKLADYQRSPARFGSKQDKAHLETQIAKADATLFGAGTLRTYGTTLPLRSPALLQQRQAQGKPPQPIQIVCSASGDLDRALPFFQQPIPRWLLTTQSGALSWRAGEEFERVLIAEINHAEVNHAEVNHAEVNQPKQGDRIHWQSALANLASLGIQHLAVLGGGTLVTALLEIGAIDGLWITLCPLLLGGTTAPTLLEGICFTEAIAPRLELIEFNAVNNETFLHYRFR